MNKKKKLKPIIIAFVIFGVIGYLIYAGLRDTMTYYLTVSEVLASTKGASNEPIRVGGLVSPSSVQWDPKELRLSFKLEEYIPGMDGSTQRRLCRSAPLNMNNLVSSKR
jgi:cytochrome c-type biogenesis protein CcmE